jgi:hypothetical protein
MAIQIGAQVIVAERPKLPTSTENTPIETRTMPISGPTICCGDFVFYLKKCKFGSTSLGSTSSKNWNTKTLWANPSGCKPRGGKLG